MSYQIYIPGERRTDALEAVGLADVLDAGNAPLALACAQGPDGGAGTVYFWEPRPKPPGYHPEHQEWTACKARRDLPAARAWFGRPTSSSSLTDEARRRVAIANRANREEEPVMSPSSLARRKQLAATAVTLADGQQWLIPTAMRLPKQWTIDDAGDGKTVVLQRYEGYYERCGKVFDYFRNFEISTQIKIPGGFSLAVEALSLNYRLNADLIDWLGLCDDEALIRILGATFKWETLRDVAGQKKTELSAITASIATAPGPPA